MNAPAPDPRPASVAIGPTPAAKADCGRYPILLADIGGTHVRLATRAARGEPIRDHRTYSTADHADLGEVIALWLADRGAPSEAPVAGAAAPGVGVAAPGTAAPGTAAPDPADDTGAAGGPRKPEPPFSDIVLAIAGPIVSGPIRLTNTRFTVDATAIARRFAPCRVHLMNDFEAQAWSLPTLDAADFRLLGSRAPAGDQTMAVLGPGTGLGCAGLVRTPAGRWLPLPGEGGHATLSAQTALEADVIARARADFRHVSAERLVSGTGLPLLYRCLADVRGEPIDPALDSGERIAVAADGSALAAATIDLFGALLGGFAGNVALILGARGGVWIAGGIAPKLFDRLAASPFRARFEQKGRFEPYLEAIGTAVVTRPDPAFDGLAYALESGGLDDEADPARFSRG